MEWSNEKTLKFIESYRAFPCLWRSIDTNYKNRVVRGDAIHELEEKYGITSKTILSKIKSLRSYFHKEYAKTVKKKSGSGACEFYKSNWFAYASLLFILDGDIHRIGTETEDSQNNEDVDSNIENEENTETDVTEQATEIITESNESQHLTSRFAKPAISTPKRMKRKQSQVDEAYGFMKEVKDHLNQRDEFSHFGEVIACKLRKLNDPRLQSMAQFEINKIMFEMETKMLDGDGQHRNYNLHIPLLHGGMPSYNSRPTTPSTGTSTSSRSTCYAPAYSNSSTPELLSPDSESLSNNVNTSNISLLQLPESNTTNFVSPLREFLHFQN